MIPTNQQLLELTITLGKQIVQLQDVMVATIEGVQSQGRFLAEKLPGLSTEEKQLLLDAEARSETATERLQAAFDGIKVLFRDIPKPD